MSEIITVEEAEVRGKHHPSGRWQKMEKPHAFTGGGAPPSPGLRLRGIFSQDPLSVNLVVAATSVFPVAQRSELTEEPGVAGAAAGTMLTARCLCSSLREEGATAPLEVGTGDVLERRRAAVPPVAADPQGAPGEAEYVWAAGVPVTRW